MLYELSFFFSFHYLLPLSFFIRQSFYEIRYEERARRNSKKRRKMQTCCVNVTLYWKISGKKKEKKKQKKEAKKLRVNLVGRLSDISAIATVEKSFTVWKIERKRARDLYLLSSCFSFASEHNTYGKAAIVASLTKISRRIVRDMLYGCGGISLYLLQKLAGCSR